MLKCTFKMEDSELDELDSEAAKSTPFDDLLVSEVSKRPVLYVSSMRGNRNLRLKENNWKAIGDELGVERE